MYHVLLQKCGCVKGSIKIEVESQSGNYVLKFGFKNCGTSCEVDNIIAGYKYTMKESLVEFENKMTLELDIDVDHSQQKEP